MRSGKGVLPVVLILLVTAMIVAPLALSGQSRAPGDKRPIEVERWPLADYDATPASPPGRAAARQARGKRHDKSGWAVNPADVADSTVRFDALDPRLPALPVTGSDAVLLAEVTEAREYLSNDKTGVYSEFTVRVAEIFKNDSRAPLAVGSLSEVEREGGRVRFSSGRVHWYAIAGSRVPRVGDRYVLFLSRGGPEEAYQLITGYELRAGRVSPLDDLPGPKAYAGADEATFLQAVRDAVVNAPR